MRKPRTYAAVLVAVLALLVTGCGSSKDSNAGAPNTGSTSSSSDSASPSASASSSGGSSASAATITIKNFKYTIAGTIAPGSSVKVTNQDSEAHTVTADKGGFDVKVDPGKTVMLTAPAQAGSYAFHCTYHSNMHGTLKVG